MGLSDRVHAPASAGRDEVACFLNLIFHAGLG